MEFTIEYWFRYNRGEDEDFEIETVKAKDYEKACKKIRKKHSTRRTKVFKCEDKTVYPEPR